MFAKMSYRMLVPRNTGMGWWKGINERRQPLTLERFSDGGQNWSISSYLLVNLE